MGFVMRYHGINFPKKEIADFCREHKIHRLSLFGSILRDDFSPRSDIDVLVEFKPGHVPSILGMVGLEAELSKIIGHKVDLRTPAELSRHFRGKILKEAKVQYVAA